MACLQPWKGSQKRYPYSQIKPKFKKKPLFLICSDLSLTLRKAPFSENFRTRMLTLIVKVVPRALPISQMSWKVKVIGQRRQSPCWKSWFLLFWWAGLCRFTFSWYIMSCYFMVGRHVILRHGVIMSFDSFWATILTTTAVSFLCGLGIIHRTDCLTWITQRLDSPRLDMLIIEETQKIAELCSLPVVWFCIIYILSI